MQHKILSTSWFEDYKYAFGGLAGLAVFGMCVQGVRKRMRQSGDDDSSDSEDDARARPN